MRAGLFTLAVTLIAAGALLLYQNLSGVAIWSRAWPFWPLVLLLLGLEFIWHARRDPGARVHRGAVIWLIILLVLAGALGGTLGAVGFAPWGWGWGWSWSWPAGSQYSHAAVLELSETVDEAAGLRELDVQTLAGDIRITGSTGREALVLAEVRVRGASESDAAANAREVELEVRREGGRLVVRIDAPTRLRPLVTADFTVTAPQDLEVTAHSVSGAIDVSGLAGDIVADTVSGDVKATVCAGDVSLKSISGAAEAGSVQGRTTIELVSGDAVIRDVAGAVDVRTISGDAQIALALALDVTVNTVSGDIEILVPPEAGLDLSLTTTSGDLETDLPIAVKKVKLGRQVNGIVNGGGAEINVTTTSGDLELRTGS